jgi:predicted RNA-binding Zn-ribbon protein involved in translation (DUF1610 family)
MKYQSHKLICPNCGNTGKIRNEYENDGKFKMSRCTKTVKIITVEHHALPECRVCGNMMDGVE